VIKVKIKTEASELRAQSIPGKERKRKLEQGEREKETEFRGSDLWVPSLLSNNPECEI